MMDASSRLSTRSVRGAVISKDGLYRYLLWRQLTPDVHHRCIFVMLNPSTADALIDDATIRKCVGFAGRWGFGAVDVCNLFALRSRDSKALLTAKDPEGIDNDAFVADAIRKASRVVWAWGQHSSGVQKLVQVRLATEGGFGHLVPRPCQAGTLGRCLNGAPKHPLMLGYQTPFQMELPGD
jgi:hypothetical protein